MADSNTPTSSDATKLISLTNLETYTGYVERKSVPVTREQYTALPSTKLTDGISYFITDEGIIIKNGVSYGASTSSDTTYSLSAGTGDDANKIILTPSSGTPDKVTVPYATTAGSADNATTVNNHTVASDVPADAVFTDNNTTYGLSVGTGDDANKIVLTPSTGTADKITVPYASNAGTVNGHSVAVDVPSDAEFTDTTYEEATTSTAGLLSSADKTKLNNLGTAAYRDIPTSGNASTSEVVLGTDTRLTDSRNAADVYSWAKAENKPTYTASEVGAIATTAKGANNGVAELDSTGKVPSSQLPSYVDDVLEYDSISEFPLTGESGKIYIAKDTNKTYRWSGTTYAEISESLALGETSSTAFRGDHGKDAYDHATDANKLTTAQSSGLYKIATTTEGHIASATAVVKSDITSLGIPGEDTNTTYALSVGTGDDANKVILTPSSGTANKITVPYATKASDADTVKGNEVSVNFIGTTDEWDALTTEQKKGYDLVYITDDFEEGDSIDADIIVYDNTVSGLSSINVQDAIDELSAAMPTITDTYSGTSSDGMSGKAVKSAIDALDVTGASNISAGKTIKSWSETDGKVSVTTQDISITKSQVSDFPTLGTASAKDVPTTGNASSSQVVMGNDSRLTDSRSASDVYSWAKAETKPTYTATEVGAIASTLKGANNGVAELDSAGKVPSSQLPSYVDDVLEYDNKAAFPATGESGKIYIAKDTNKTFRWSGSAYVEISESLALGETSSTAYRGDRGKTAYDHATDSNRLTTTTTSGLYKIGVTSEGHVSSATAVVKADITGLGIPAQDTTYSAASNSGISLDNSTNAFSNSGVRATTVGSTQGTVSVNTNGTSADVGLNGVYFGYIGTAQDLSITQKSTGSATIEATVSQPVSSFSIGDKVVLFSYKEYDFTGATGSNMYLKINNMTAYQVYNKKGSIDISVVTTLPNKTAYTFTYGTYNSTPVWIVDDLHLDDAAFIKASTDKLSGATVELKLKDAGTRIQYSKFIGTTEEWNALSTSEKKKYDEAILTDD